MMGSFAADISPAWLQTLGRFHVAIVHFPIALLLVAGMVEAWRALRRKKQLKREQEEREGAAAES